MKIILQYILLGFALVLVGCGVQPNWRGPQNLDQKYANLLHKWTHSAQIYHFLDSILLVHCTYLAPELREAFGEQYLKIFAIDPGKVDSDLEMIATSVGRGHEFFLFADSNNPEWNNLDERDSVWRLGLWGADDQPGVPPISIHRFEGRGPNLKAFFPYITRFGRSYLVSFPLEQSNGKPIKSMEKKILELKLASAFGTAMLRWKVKE